MSNTVLLSAQITTLEALAEPLTELRGELEILNREREDLDPPNHAGGAGASAARLDRPARGSRP